MGIKLKRSAFLLTKEVKSKESKMRKQSHIIFHGLPNELEEDVKMDEASDYEVLFKTLLPLAKPIITVNSLY